MSCPPCPICLEEFQHAVMAPCCHVYCLPCIEAWTTDSSTCPICRGPIQPLRDTPWLNKPTEIDSESQSINSETLGISGSLDKTDFRAKRLSELVDRLKNKPKELYVSESRNTEARYEYRVSSLVKQKEKKEQKLRKKLIELEANLQKDLQAQYKEYQDELNEEEITKKKIDSDNEYIDFLVNIGTSLSSQSSTVLDQHYQPYVDKMATFIPMFMGMAIEDPCWFYMPETPVCYVFQVNKLLVGDGKSLWYYQEPQMSITHQGHFVQGDEFLYLVEPQCVHKYNFNLSPAGKIENTFRDYGHGYGHEMYFVTISNQGSVLKKPVNSPITWNNFTIEEDYDNIYWADDVLVTVKDRTARIYYQNGTLEIYKPRGPDYPNEIVKEIRRNGTITLVTYNHSKVTPIFKHFGTAGLVTVWNSSKPSLTIGKNILNGPQLNGKFTNIIFSDAVMGVNETDQPQGMRQMALIYKTNPQ